MFCCLEISKGISYGICRRQHIGYEVPLFFMYSTTGKAKMSNGNIKKRSKKIRVSPKKRGTRILIWCKKLNAVQSVLIMKFLMFCDKESVLHRYD